MSLRQMPNETEKREDARGQENAQKKTVTGRAVKNIITNALLAIVAVLVIPIIAYSLKKQARGGHG